ncbi:hypothetical protein KCU61_g335, partial [Aureobasidium melanogenum]
MGNFQPSHTLLQDRVQHVTLQGLDMETKLFLLATLGLTGDALCGIGGGLGMGELAEAGRGEPDTFLSMPFKLLLRLSSPFGVPIGVGGSSLLGGGGFSLSSSTGDVALATNAGPGWEVSDTADCDRCVFATCGSAEGTSSVFLTEGFFACTDLRDPLVQARLMAFAAVTSESILLFSMRSISPKTVVPFVARFSSAMGWNRRMPLSGGTARMSAMKDWIRAELRLLVTGCN